MPVSEPANQGELAESASTTGSHGVIALEAAPALVGARHADVHVQALHPLAPDGDAAVADERHVALLLDDRLRFGQRERMRCGRRDREPLGLGGVRGCPPEHRQRSSDLGHGRADVGVGLEDRGEELGLQPPRQLAALDALQDAIDRCDLLVRLRVEDHQLLLDAERELRRAAELLLDHVLARTPCTGRPAATQA